MSDKCRAARFVLCILAAAAAVLCSVPPCRAAQRQADAPERRVMPTQEDIIKNIPGGREGLKTQIVEDVQRRSKKNFIRLYQTLWRSNSMAEGLDNAIDKAFEECTAGLMWGTAGIQLAANKDNIIESIQESVAFKITPLYDEFLHMLEDRWSETLRSDIVNFYTMNIAQTLASDTNAMSQAWLRQDHSSITETSGGKMLERLKNDMKTKYPDISVAETGVFMGLAGIVFRKQIANWMSKFLLRKGAKTAAAKAVGAAIPVANIIMLLWGTYDILSMAWDAKSEIQRQIHELNQSLYYTEVPQIYWDVMEPYVIDIFASAYVESQLTIEQAKIISKDPKIMELSKGLGENERRAFTERVAAILHSFGGVDYDEMLDSFGPLIRSATPADFPRLADMISHGRLDRLKAWFDIAGEARYYNMYASFTPEVWDYFPPSPESLEMLTWMMMNLTPGARAVAASMPAHDIHWLMNDMPSRYIPRLFAESYGPSAIREEITRLSQISDKDSRIPWQGTWEYRWAKYGPMLVWGGAGFAVLMVLLLVMSFTRRHRARTENTQPSGSYQAAQAQQPVPAPYQSSDIGMQHNTSYGTDDTPAPRRSLDLGKPAAAASETGDTADEPLVPKREINIGLPPTPPIRQTPAPSTADAPAVSIAGTNPPAAPQPVPPDMTAAVQTPQQEFISAAPPVPPARPAQPAPSQTQTQQAAPQPQQAVRNGTQQRHSGPPYTVKLVVSEQIAHRLMTTMWDPSQRLEPTRNGQWSFCVDNINDLSSLASWVAHDPANIGIIQPPELIAEVRRALGMDQ